MRFSRLLFAYLFLFVAAILTACGAIGDDDAARRSEGDVSCVPLSVLRGYRFMATAVVEVQEGEQPLADSPVGPEPFRLVVEVEAEAQGEERLRSFVRHGNEEAFSARSETVIVEDTMWKLLGGVWVENPRSPVAVPYTAIETCRAIAPDLAISGLSGTAEEVNGIPALHYTLELPNEFFGRHPNVGSSSDLATRIDSVNVEVWIAQGGNYPVKVDVTGEGTYPDGRRIIGEIGYELFDVNADDVNIQPPE